MKYCLKHNLKSEEECDENCVKFGEGSIFENSLKAFEKWLKETPEEEKKAQMLKYHNPDNKSNDEPTLLDYINNSK